MASEVPRATVEDQVAQKSSGERSVVSALGCVGCVQADHLVDRREHPKLLNDGGGHTAGSNFEETDFIDVHVNGNSVFFKNGVGDHIVGDAVGGLNDLNAPYINNWAPESVDISAFDGQILNISFAIANNTAPEDIAFDNVTVFGVPEPASLSLLVLGSLLLVRRQRF